MRLLETWWSPAAERYRVEDGKMFTYYPRDLDALAHHLKSEGATALLQSPPHNEHTARLLRALEEAGVSVEYK